MNQKVYLLPIDRCELKDVHILLVQPAPKFESHFVAFFTIFLLQTIFRTFFLKKKMKRYMKQKRARH